MRRPEFHYLDKRSWVRAWPRPVVRLVAVLVGLAAPFLCAVLVVVRNAGEIADEVAGVWRCAIGRWVPVALVGIFLAGCSLTPAHSPARFHAAYWCPADSADLSCDGGMGASLATWSVDGYGRYVSLVAVLGADTLGGGAAWTINRGSDRMPLIAVGVGGVCPYDTEAGVSTDGCGPVLGVTAGWGDGK